MTRSLAPLVALVIMAGATGSAGAIPFIDSTNGFKVDPPAPYYVQPAKSTTYDDAVVIHSQTDMPPTAPGDAYLCQIGFKADPNLAELTQADINAQVQQPGWLDKASAALSQTYTLNLKSTFTQDGATGLEFAGQPKAGTGVGVFISLIDTPAGRTTLNCATPADKLDGALEQFRLIRGSITLPGKKQP